MGTYAPGEIASLCSWCPPEIAVITALGPVHLERMKSMSVIEQAKYEITQRAHTVVVNIDDVRLALWPELLDRDAKRVRTAGSKNAAAFVRVVASDNTWNVSIDGVAVTLIAPILGVQPTNLACAIAAALELGVGPDEVASRIQRVHGVANRSNVVTAASGVVVIDDTFNANPASAEAALTLLRSLELGGRRVVVTPGLIELGQDQHAENLSLAQKVEANGGELVVVGRTNARALLGGYAKDARRFDTRDQAVAWVRSALVTGDGVLYLNDLPDHYP
jgi:UDP-N-acetylmuramoyl-tripeptide--D-alanyl-D-alanine ligase